MQGKLIKFEPLMKGTVHDSHNGFWKFSVTIQDNVSTFTGEAVSKAQTGSKNWTIGEVHEYNTKENSYAINGIQIQGLKKIEKAAAAGTSDSNHGYDIHKEAYIIARFAHSFGLEYLNKMPDEQRKTFYDQHKEHSVSVMAKTIAHSVHKLAIELIAYEQPNGQTS